MLWLVCSTYDGGVICFTCNLCGLVGVTLYQGLSNVIQRPKFPIKI